VNEETSVVRMWSYRSESEDFSPVFHESDACTWLSELERRVYEARALYSR